jgi:hypothetical protein
VAACGRRPAVFVRTQPIIYALQQFKAAVRKIVAAPDGRLFGCDGLRGRHALDLGPSGTASSCRALNSMVPRRVETRIMSPGTIPRGTIRLTYRTL